MASRPAPGGLLEAPQEATGEQFALLDNKCRCGEVGGPSHCIGLRKRSFEEFDMHDRSKHPSKAHAPSVYVASQRKRKARTFQRLQKKQA